NSRRKVSSRRANMFGDFFEPILRSASGAWTSLVGIGKRSFLRIEKRLRAWWYGEDRRDFDGVLDEEKKEILRARDLRSGVKAVAVAEAAAAAGLGGVVTSEVGQIQQRRGESGPLDDIVGLAFSGGGIRSATFNLGVLQALANKGYLKQIDYLSTVSGGGYIGAWLTAWIKRKGCAEVEKKLANNRDESPPHEPWRY